jgi:hypothetical protein
MANRNDDELPGFTLPGAQDKVQAQFIDGHYVICKSPGPLRLSAFPAPPPHPRKVAEFRNESGPPSIVDTIIGPRSDYEGECGRTPVAAISNRYEVERVLRAAVEFKERTLGR